MPFTLSHPAFAVPFRRLLPGKLALSGIVLGSMAPDLEYFARMEAAGTIGHRLTGFVLIDLPLCTALCCAYLFIVRPALAGFVPSIGGLRDYVYDSIRDLGSITVLDWLLFLLAAFAGFGTHLFMDAWTHSSGWFVQRIAALREPMMGDYVYQWLQYLTSLVGALGCAAWLAFDWFRWYRGYNHAQRRESRAKQAHGINYAFIVHWTAACMVGVLVLLVKLDSVWSPFLLYVWTVAPFSAAAVGIYAASILALTNQARQWSHGLSIIVLLLATMWALKLGIVSFAAIRLNLYLSPIERWVGTIWIFSAAIMLLSVHINRLVKEFVRIGLKTVNNRTLS
ncbi:DUF4184 family protein [Paenibacillus kobensis]|uniref:DUF4184 family protein n=1 Tax=Paenibacillus kobensis TaxID=59841 RepID=UPI0013E30040|nr:DUF4184 family protein [Paenibacillus kobensis]